MSETDVNPVLDRAREWRKGKKKNLGDDEDNKLSVSIPFTTPCWVLASHYNTYQSITTILAITRRQLTYPNQSSCLNFSRFVPFCPRLSIKVIWIRGRRSDNAALFQS